MRNFQLLVHGMDTTQILMSYKKELGGSGEEEIVLFDGEEWQGSVFAVPQLRPVLLNMMRAAEVSKLRRVVLWDVPPKSRRELDFAVDTVQDGLVTCILQAGDCEMTSGTERTKVPGQSLLWMRCGEGNAIENLDELLSAIVVGMYYVPMP